MGKPLVLALMVSLVLRTSAYFEYSDCDEYCQLQNRSCTIAMINEHNFPSDCTPLDAGCLRLASRQIVCLRKLFPAVGGEDIWPEFAKHHRPNTTTVTPPPSPGPNPSPTPGPNPSPSPTPDPSPSNKYIKKWFTILVGYSIATSLCLLAIAGVTLKRFVGKRTMRHEPLIEDRQLLDTPGSPYRSTTTPIDSPAQD